MWAVSSHLATPLRLRQKKKAQRLGVCYGALVVARVALQQQHGPYSAKSVMVK